MNWLLVLGLEEGLVECVTLCVKSWVILRNLYGEPEHVRQIHLVVWATFQKSRIIRIVTFGRLSGTYFDFCVLLITM